MSYPFLSQILFVTFGFALGSFKFLFSLLLSHLLQRDVHPFVLLFNCLKLLLLLWRRLLLQILSLSRVERVPELGNDLCNFLNSSINFRLDLVENCHQGFDKKNREQSVGKKVLTQSAQILSTNLKEAKNLCVLRSQGKYYVKFLIHQIINRKLKSNRGITATSKLRQKFCD